MHIKTFSVKHWVHLKVLQPKSMLISPEATTKFMNARPVPYALKAKVELELDRLQSENIMSPVEFSEWAAPVVKQDGPAFAETTRVQLTRSQS